MAENLTANAYTRDGYTFEGWNTKPDGTGTGYTDRAQVRDLTADDKGRVVLYAQWKAVQLPQTGMTAGLLLPAVLLTGMAAYGTILSRRRRD